MKFVRMKPYNGRNHVSKTYVVGGVKFVHGQWTRVPDDLAEYLKDRKQIHDGPDSEYSADLFDIVDTIDEVNEFNAKERAKARAAKAGGVSHMERKVRVHTPHMGRTAPMKIVKPGRTGSTKSVAGVPKYAHADRVVEQRPVFDEQSEEFEDDMAGALSDTELDQLEDDADAAEENLTDEDFEGEEGDEELDTEAGLLPQERRSKKTKKAKAKAKSS